ncbi:MAG: MerR family transcriptional regulator, partial [Mycobacterium sp.]|nr:MerR family transcriptional regulator [Mycobacterium sp.]
MTAADGEVDSDRTGASNSGAATQGSLDDIAPGIFPNDTVPDELVGYRVPSACQIAGITYRQLDYWA